MSAFLTSPWPLLLKYYAPNALLLIKNQSAHLQVSSNRNHAGFGDGSGFFGILSAVSSFLRVEPAAGISHCLQGPFFNHWRWQS